MAEIEHDWELTPVCPYCGEEIEDAWEYGLGGDGASCEAECPECNREFRVTKYVTVRYLTEKLGGER